MSNAQHDDFIIRPNQLRSVDGLGDTARRAMQQRGEYPAYRQVSPHAVGVLWSELRAWLQSRPVATGNRPGPGRGKKKATA